MNTKVTALLLAALVLLFASTCSQPAHAARHQRQPDAAQQQTTPDTAKEQKKCNRPKPRMTDNWLTRSMRKTGRWLRGLPDEPPQDTPQTPPARSTPHRNSKP